MGLDKHLIQSFGTVLGHGQTDNDTAGTAVILFTAAHSIEVIVKAKSTNDGMVFVGDSDVTTATGYILDAGEEVTIKLDHLSDSIYFDVDTSGEGVSYLTVV